MASYNGEKYLVEQLESILKQLGTADELVISDDSSTDGTLTVLSGYPDRRIKVVAGNSFFNPIFNFENALKQAEGEVIVLADQDDIWLENKLAVVRDLFLKKPSPIYTVVLDGQVINESGDILHESIFELHASRKGLLKNLRHNSFMGCCMAFSRELLPIALPFPKGIPMHDSWLGLLSELFGTVEFVPVKTILYRKHQTNQSLQGFKPTQKLRWRYLLSRHLIGRRLSRRKKEVISQ
jgi:glycosyltransferase involved in cell wall biosynthesis